MERRPLVMQGDGIPAPLSPEDTLPGALFVFKTEAEFNAAEATIPMGAEVVKLWEANGGQMIVPDYANIESTNRIDAIGVQWTADRTGFVFVGFLADPGAGQYRRMIVKINGKDVWLNFSSAALGGLGWHWSTILPIAKDDVIELAGDNSMSSPSYFCRFIPPKFITVQAPNIIAPLPSYSLDEQATGETWIDGKPIYRKSILWNNPVTIEGESDTGFSAPSDIDAILDTKLSFRRTNPIADGNIKCCLPVPGYISAAHHFSFYAPEPFDAVPNESVLTYTYTRGS
jgi:hypothetical protein